MTAGDLAVVLAAVLCSIGFAALNSNVASTHFARARRLPSAPSVSTPVAAYVNAMLMNLPICVQKPPPILGDRFY